MPEQFKPEYFRGKLLELRQQLLDLEEVGRAAADTVELDQTRVGRLSRMDALQAQAMSQASNRRRHVEIRAIEAALIRLDEYEYGDCVACGEPINPQRLALNPTARRCIACAEKLE